LETTPKFSIIIPTYNSAVTLKSCLESIVNQDYLNVEVYIIDGLSTDETLQIIDQYKSNYNFIKFISEADKGIYDAMNKGISLCTGEWLYFLGSDDTLYSETVLSDIAERISTCDAKVIYGNVMMRGTNQWNLDNVIFNGEYDLPKMILDNICHQAIFYNRIVFNKYGNYNLKYITAADYDFNLRCYASTSFVYVNVIIANFFVGGQSTNVPDYEIQKDRGALLLKYYGKRIFNKSFLSCRLYIQRAALAYDSPLRLWERIFCLLAYLKLKTNACFNETSN
jgi:glycosyltransferase involved in cell wall biosynthesis